MSDSVNQVPASLDADDAPDTGFATRVAQVVADAKGTKSVSNSMYIRQGYHNLEVIEYKLLDRTTTKPLSIEVWLTVVSSDTMVAGTKCVERWNLDRVVNSDFKGPTQLDRAVAFLAQLFNAPLADAQVRFSEIIQGGSKAAEGLVINCKATPSQGTNGKTYVNKYWNYVAPGTAVAAKSPSPTAVIAAAAPVVAPVAPAADDDAIDAEGLTSADRALLAATPQSTVDSENLL